MLRNEKLYLPEDWESTLELSMLRRPVGIKLARSYICSPCRADTAEGVFRNIKAARVYMHYAYVHFQGVPRAPHAYLPILLNDNFEDERELALDFGTRLLLDCDLMLVCGDRLSEGMYGEIVAAVKIKTPVQVFNSSIYDALRERLASDGHEHDHPYHDESRRHYALEMGADELAAYWRDGQL